MRSDFCLLTRITSLLTSPSESPESQTFALASPFDRTSNFRGRSKSVKQRPLSQRATIPLFQAATRWQRPNSGARLPRQRRALATSPRPDVHLATGESRPKYDDTDPLLNCQAGWRAPDALKCFRVGCSGKAFGSERGLFRRQLRRRKAYRTRSQWKLKHPPPIRILSRFWTLAERLTDDWTLMRSSALWPAKFLGGLTFFALFQLRTGILEHKPTLFPLMDRFPAPALIGNHASFTGRRIQP